MTNEALKRAREIEDRLDDLSKLRYIACQPYKRYFLTKKFLWITRYEQDDVMLCDKGLTDVIREYCDKKIAELQKELEAL